MGIPSYFSFIVKNHLSILKKLGSIPLQVHHLYIDANSIIYDAIRTIDFKALKESEVDAILSAVSLKIDEYILLLKPLHTIFIAFDGVAPVAKLEQQRSRRYKSNFQNQLVKSSLEPDPWNTAAITPGTMFMQHLNKRMHRHFDTASKYGVVNLIVSGSDEYGEGEHKLFQYMRSHPEEHLDATTVIYGLDADLIMLSLNHLRITPRTFLFRETPEFIKSIQVELEPNEAYLMDMGELAVSIRQEMSVYSGTPGSIDRMHDYIFLCFFLGNDFLPHFPALNIRTGGIHKLLNAYKATMGSTVSDVLTDGNQIFWPHVRRWVEFLAKQEQEFLQKETKLRHSRARYQTVEEDVLKKLDAIPMTDMTLEESINPFQPGWQKRYYKNLMEMDILDDVRRRQLCINYMEGLEWTMAYYTHGCLNWRWKYNYHYPPLLTDLLSYIPASSSNQRWIQSMPANPVSDLVQLCYVLPKTSLHLLPEKLYKNLIKKRSYWHSADCLCIWAYCRYFWECHVQLPFIPIDDLERFVAENK